MKIALNKLIYLLLLLTGASIQAQTVAIPDLNFRNFLINQFPYVMNEQQELILASADTVTRTIYCAGLEIENMEGLQYFTNIRTVLCFRNKISSFPDLSNLTSLTELSCFENRVSDFTPFNNLQSIEDLDFGDNYLTDLSGIANLKTLKILTLYRNKLTEIPDLTALKALEKLHCYENSITKIGKLPGSMKDLWFGDNLITDFPDISLAKDIEHIGAYTNRLNGIPELREYKRLKDINFGTNRIASVPESLKEMVWIEKIILDNNQLTMLPDLSNLTLLTEVNLEQNFLTFEDLLPSAHNPGFSNWTIAPQAQVPITRSFNAREQQSFTILQNVDAGVPDLTYTWFHNGVLLKQTSSPVLEIATVEKADTGDYQFTITSSNPLLSTLTLKSPAFKLKVTPEFTVDKDLSITPNGDGRNDEIYFKEAGPLYIYDSQGRLIDELVAPCLWNGTTKSGIEIGTGVYMIQIDEKARYEITIIR